MTVAAPKPGCVSYGPNVIVCGTGGFRYRRLLHCETCGRRRRFVVRWQMWYGQDATCTACGDTWCDEGMLGRPFKPGWRKEAAARAKELYAEAMTYREFTRAERAYLRWYFSEDGDA